MWVIKGLTKENIFGPNCSFPMGLKQHLHKHICGLSIRLGYAEPPLAAKDVPISQKRYKEED